MDQSAEVPIFNRPSELPRIPHGLSGQSLESSKLADYSSSESQSHYKESHGSDDHEEAQEKMAASGNLDRPNKVLIRKKKPQQMNMYLKPQDKMKIKDQTIERDK